ncbi:MAG: phage tail protein [Lachnospiraceae bacterium]|nr:phage tail protein [Lachnospiraceae bacterium]
MLGGGNYISQNKILPGAYMNFVSASGLAANLGARGYAALALPLKWGVDGQIFTVTADDFRKRALQIFGFTYESEEAKGLRDLFKNITTLYCYKLMNGGAYASNAVARAKYKGSTGTKISTEILSGTVEGTYDVNIYMGTVLVYSKTVTTIEELKTDDNGWVEWTLEIMAAAERANLTGIELDGSQITAAEHSEFLNASQKFTFNAMGCLSEEDAIKDLYLQECKDMRNDYGVKYKLIVFNKAADFEGVINVKNAIEAVYWTTGVEAGCAVNESNTNKVYDGEFDFPTSYTKAELEAAIMAGEFVFHQVGDEVRVLEDINSLVTLTAEKNEEFKSNQTIRVIDQIAMDIAKIFNDKYLGKIPNNASGRISLWNDIVKHHQELQSIRAIENFVPANVSVELGENKKSVVVSDVITVVNAMSQLYMSVVVQ